jgi:hypothetical protein
VARVNIFKIKDSIFTEGNYYLINDHTVCITMLIETKGGFINLKATAIDILNCSFSKSIVESGGALYLFPISISIIKIINSSFTEL